MTVAADGQALADASAARVTTLIEEAIAARGAAWWCLTGGETPARLYRVLADASRPWRARIDWARVHVYWGDERHVPPDHPDSNYGMAARALLQHVPIPPALVHRVRAELPDAAAAARQYEPELPATFDVMLLGLGEDAHVASLFPGSPLLAPMQGLPRVAAVWAEHLHAWRITLTPAPILASRAIMMLVAGEQKAAAVQAAIDSAEDVARYPAQVLRPAGDRVEWFVDRAAASRLSSGPGR